LAALPTIGLLTEINLLGLRIRRGSGGGLRRNLQMIFTSAFSAANSPSLNYGHRARASPKTNSSDKSLQMPLLFNPFHKPPLWPMGRRRRGSIQTKKISRVRLISPTLTALLLTWSAIVSCSFFVQFSSHLDWPLIAPGVQELLSFNWRKFVGICIHKSATVFGTL
jgi:hypothetical protein